MKNIERVKLIHHAFRITTFLKGVYSFFEMLSGLLLLIISKGAIVNFFENLFRHELLEDPNGIISNVFVKTIIHLSSSTEKFIGIYFLIHGAIKFGLIFALWLEKPVAYPIAMVVFVLFIIYQVYKYVLSPSWILIYLTVLDLLVIVLTYFEYKHLSYWIELKKKGKVEIF